MSYIKTLIVRIKKRTSTQYNCLKFMHLSLSTEYSIHSLVYLAMNPDKEIHFVDEVARAQNISSSYLAKVFRVLAKSGILNSYRGAGGGYSLALDPKDITFRRIVESIEGRDSLFLCQEEKLHCRIGMNCIIKSAMSHAEQKMYEILEETTIADVMREFRDQTQYPFWHTRNINLVNNRNQRIQPVRNR